MHSLVDTAKEAHGPCDLIQRPIYVCNWNTHTHTRTHKPGRVAQSVARLTQEPEVPGSIPGPATYFLSPSAVSGRAVVSYWRKYVHELLVNRFGGGLCLPKKKVAWLTGHPDTTVAVYLGR